MYVFLTKRTFIKAKIFFIMDRIKTKIKAHYLFFFEKKFSSKGLITIFFQKNYFIKVNIKEYFNFNTVMFIDQFYILKQKNYLIILNTYLMLYII